MNKKSVIEVIREHKDILKQYGIEKIGIFGSVVRNENKPNSDLDIIFIFSKGMKTFQNLISAHDLLERRLKIKVDAVTPESVSSYIKPYIDQEVQYETL